jgi:hypothetical protein
MKLLLTLSVLIFANIAFSQDIILLKDGTNIQSKIIEVSENEVKYRRQNNVDGPTFVISKLKVLQLKYKNGDVDDIRALDANHGISLQKLNEIYTQANPPKVLAALEKEEIIRNSTGHLVSKGKEFVTLAGAIFHSGMLSTENNEVNSIVFVKLLLTGETLNTNNLDDKPYNYRGEKYDIIGNLTHKYDLVKNQNLENIEQSEKDYSVLRTEIFASYGSPKGILNGAEYWAIDTNTILTLTKRETYKPTADSYYSQRYVELNLRIGRSLQKEGQAKVRAEQKAADKFTSYLTKVDELIGETFIPDPSVNYDSLSYPALYTALARSGKKTKDDANKHITLLFNRGEGDLLSTRSKLRRDGYFYKIESRGLITLATNEVPFFHKGVAFNNGGITLNGDGTFKQILLLKTVETAKNLSKDELKTKVSEFKSIYERLGKTHIAEGS